MRRHTAVLVAVLLLTTVAPAQGRAEASHPDSDVAVAWQRTTVRTVFTEGGSAAPVGPLYMAFASLAAKTAVDEADKRGGASAEAALATATHDVLATYFPNSTANLAADLAATLASVPDGPREAKGIRIGQRAAAQMVASRVGDGRNDTSVVYAKPAGPGVWQPAPGGVMAFAWLGFVKPIVLTEAVALDGPDTLDSAAFAADFAEVHALGGKVSHRTPDQTAVAAFFASGAPNAVYRNALNEYLTAQPIPLDDAVDLFAAVDAAVADTFIQSWRLKFDVGFWRPSQAIAASGDMTWSALLTVPSYSDYTTGHGSATAPFAEVVREMLGDGVVLQLRNAAGASRTYQTLTALEHDALNSRIWGGLHFRDAMEDGYHLGHETARRVLATLD